jgi:hypothetical protein
MAEVHLERAAHQPLPPSVSHPHQSPTQGSLPGLGPQPLVHEIPSEAGDQLHLPIPIGPWPLEARGSQVALMAGPPHLVIALQGVPGH